MPIMKLVEIVRGGATSQSTFDALCEYGSAVGKTVVRCIDTPGFVVNRLLVPYMAEAVRLLERGDASVADIDVAMRLGAAHPMGPLTLLDYVGLDTSLFILQGWTRDYPGTPQFDVPPLLKAMVESGAHGNKNGKGFYVDGKPNPQFFDAQGYILKSKL